MLDTVPIYYTIEREVAVMGEFLGSSSEHNFIFMYITVVYSYTVGILYNIMSYYNYHWAIY